MKLKIIKSEGIAHSSYFLSDGEEAVVVDPRRDCQIYTRLAQKECAKIRYILETHRNEDYVIGSFELQNITDAEICHSNALPFKYGDHNLSDGETLSVGNLTIKALHTPGHTNESLCYVVHRPEQSSEALMVFTGDTLFAGSVGRTDLYGKEAHPTQAEKLYTSIHEKLLPLGNHVIIYPAHGAGSVCGHDISDQEFSTLGYENKTNPFLQLDTEAFVKRAMNEEMMVPPYFRKMEDYNLNGPPLLRGLPPPEPLNVSEFEQEMRQPDTVVVDTRMPYAFAGAFIPGALSIWLGGTSAHPGWILDYNQKIVFVHERKSDMNTVAAHFWRLGFDNLLGFLCPGIGEWHDTGKPISHVGTLSASELKERLEENLLSVVDVREPREWKEGYIEGAERIFFGHLAGKAGSLPGDKPVAVICSVGQRASIAASILKKEGFHEVYNVLGGMTAWTNLGYPTVK
ncbi:MBL fold metallo-hydrolase [Candidatus Bathyarchaeota archaeon]|nr:MBL fold metallo-hydrolase [Candidatus Bathyarchaeota archaeon]